MMMMITGLITVIMYDDHGQQPTQCHSGWWLVTSDLSTAAAVVVWWPEQHQSRLQSQHHPPVAAMPAIATNPPTAPASTQPEVASYRFKYVSWLECWRGPTPPHHCQDTWHPSTQPIPHLANSTFSPRTCHWNRRVSWSELGQSHD